MTGRELHRKHVCTASKQEDLCSRYYIALLDAIRIPCLTTRFSDWKVTQIEYTRYSDPAFWAASSAGHSRRHSGTDVDEDDRRRTYQTFDSIDGCQHVELLMSKLGI
jgi:hypothetical protein